METHWNDLRRLYKTKKITKKEFNKLAWNLEDPWTITLRHRLLNPSLSAASRVANTPELLEMILLHVDSRSLRTVMQRTSKFFRNIIQGSIKLQRRLHYAPLWTQSIMDLSPLPQRKPWVSYSESVTSRIIYPGLPPKTNAKHEMFLRNPEDALSWASNPDRLKSKSFRRMQLSRPPVLSVEFRCWIWSEELNTNVRWEPTIENEGGVTWGEVVDILIGAKGEMMNPISMVYTLSGVTYEGERWW